MSYFKINLTHQFGQVNNDIEMVENNLISLIRFQLINSVVGCHVTN